MGAYPLDDIIMEKVTKLIIIIAMMCVLFIFFIIAIMVNAEKNCEEYGIICYRTEAVFAGTKDIKTRCVNDWDFQREQCVNFGYFWED